MIHTCTGFSHRCLKSSRARSKNSLTEILQKKIMLKLVYYYYTLEKKINF